MQIIATVKIEDCFDGSQVYQYRLDQPWQDNGIKQLAQLGNLQYFPEFPRPFFRVHTPAGVQITGIGGDDACRVVYPKQNQAQIKEQLENWLVTEKNKNERESIHAYGTTIS